MSLFTTSLIRADIASDNNTSPTFGNRLLPSVLDQWARDDPARLYAVIPHAHNADEGFDDITMLQVSHAVDVTAWWLIQAFGVSTTSQCLAYIGIADLRYPIVHIATMKLGWTLVLLGTRNTASQNHKILERTKCSRILYAAEMGLKVEELLSVAEFLACMPFASLSEILAMRPQAFPYGKTFLQAKHEPTLVLHSSGTTGEPKLVTMTHGTFSATDLDHSTPTPPGRQAQNAAMFTFYGGGKAYSCFPPYHLAGVQAFTILPIFYGSTAVFGPSSMPASGHLLYEIMRRVDLKSIYAPPAIIEAWIQIPGALEQAKSLNFVLYGGGTLSPRIGNVLEDSCNVCQVYGSTEIGQVQLLVPLKGNWAHLELNPLDNVDMQLSQQHGAYEMVLHQDPVLNDRRSLYHNFPEIETWRTGDLFLPHPKKPGLWDFGGRVDDLIILSSGHKVNPVVMETCIQDHRLVTGALIVGTARPYPALLLELTTEAMEHNHYWLIDCLWPAIEAANSSVPGYGQILRSMVLISNIGKPFIRAAKGSIVRKTTVDNYAAEIDDLYSGVSAAETLNSDSIQDMVMVTLRQFVRRTVDSLLPHAMVSDAQNLFYRGLDSLKVIQLRNAVQDGFYSMRSITQPAITLETIYNCPTIAELAQAIFFKLIQGSDIPRNLHSPRAQSLIEKYTNDLENESEREVSIIVLLTGSTGTLGRNLLRTLLNDPGISQVICLGRHPAGKDNQARIYHDENGDDCVDLSKAQFLCVDLSEWRLGLTEKLWFEIAGSVHVIIHTAWTVDFNLPMSHFESHHIRGLRSLIDLSQDGRHHPRIAFTSSTTTMSNWHLTHASISVPESIATDYKTTFPMGYSQSKFVAERILAIASERCNLPVTILRIGQIAGSVSDPPGSQWPVHESLPLIMQSSKSMKLLPTFNAPCDWIPVDVVAQIIHEVLFSAIKRKSKTESNPGQSLVDVYNLVNPHQIPWVVLNKILSQHLGQNTQVVSLNDWIGALKRDRAEGLDAMASRPALKILPFLESLAAKDRQSEAQCLTFDTAKGVKDSQTMASLQPINAKWIDEWIKQWGV